MKTKTILSVFCLLSAYCLLSTAYCFSAVPSLINYQGVLKDSTGVPYNGNATMVFSIWDDSADGSKLWQETQDIVSLSHGLFNVLLGSSHTIPDSVFAQPNSWLQVIANGSQLSPRRQIVSVGYALHSEFTDTAEYARSAPPDDDWDIDTSGFNVYRLTGNVGIGKPSPQYKLDVAGTAQMTGFKMPTDASDDYVLTSNASGAGTWQAQSGVPSGVIVMWSGTIGDIPEGWALCDGTNGTPDLTDRFVKSVPNSLTDPGSTGGAATHNHGGATGSHTLTIAEMPAHNHSGTFGRYCQVGDPPNIAGYGNSAVNPYTVAVPSQGGGGGHTHTINSDSSLPPYYELAFIMKL